MSRYTGFLLALFLSAMLLPATPASACPTEADLADIGAEPGAALADCRALSRFTIPTGRGPVDGVVYGGPEADPAMVAVIETALIRSGNVLQRLGALGSEPVEAYISPTPYIPDADGGDFAATAAPAMDVGPGNPSTCVIATFSGNPPDVLGSTIAHEFFHCVQYNEFPSQMEAAGSNWWDEGTAEWFASLVYQGRSDLDYAVATFDTLSPDTPITGMEYDNVVFFWWLSQNYGSGAVVELIRAMPGPGGSQNDALAGVVDDDMFLQFVQDYLDRKITQPGGRSIPSNPRLGEEFRIRQDREITLSAARFVAYRVRLELNCGEWTASNNGLKGRYELQRKPGEDWEELPETITSDSEETIRYQLAAGGTGAEGYSVEIKLEKTPCALCKNANYTESPEADLVGEWRLASGGMGAKLSEMLNRVPDLQNVDYPDMDGVLILNADGSFVLRADDSGSAQTTTPDGDVFNAEMLFNMQRRGTWTLNGNKLEQCYSPDIDIGIDTTVTDPDGFSETISMREFLGPRQSYTIKRRYVYTPGRLELTERALFAPTITWVYER